jgi:hypothetical protein
MRWLVEVTSLSSSDRDSRQVDADTWQTALQAARALRGETAPMNGFSIELLDEGCRAVDQVSRLRYDVRRAEDAVPPSRSGGTLPPPAFHPGPRADVLGTVPSQVVFKREEDATETMPLTYREYVYLVPPGTPETAAEALLVTQLELVRTSLERTPPGKLVNLAVVDAPYQGRSHARPLATLTWKDWRGAPVTTFPRRPGGPAPVHTTATGTVVMAPADAPVPSAPAAPVPAAHHPSAPPPAFPAPAPVAAFTPAPPAAFAPAPPVPAFTPPPPAYGAAPVPAFAAPVAMPLPEPPPVPAASVPPSPFAPAPESSAAAVQAIASMLSGAPAAPGAAVPAPPIPPAAPLPASAGIPAGAAVPVSVAAPAAIPSAMSPAMAAPAPAQAALPPGAGLRVSAPPAARVESMRPGARVRGEDLIADLFEAMHELNFARDAIEGGDYCLALAMAKLPCAVGIFHQYDIDRREFLVTCARGAGAPELVLRRHPESDRLLSSAARRRRAIVLTDATQGDAASVERYLAVGGARSVIVAPVLQSGRYLGAIELLNPTDGQPFTEAEGNAVMYIAEQLAEFVAARGVVIDPERIRAHRST